MKSRSWKFWTLFWLTAAILLAGWFFLLEWRQVGFRAFDWAVKPLPVESELKSDMQALTALADYVLKTNGEERTFLVLFQNNMELRPGGGFIGSFGVLKIKDGQATDFQVHDSGNFDGRIPDTIEPPYPMRETLKIGSWKLRDSNWSPDFPINARQAEEFYHMGGGQETFDGVVAITTNVLTSFLRVTGPVTLEGFSGEYGADNAINDLEYQVEQGYLKQEIDFAERKSVMNILGWEVLRKAKALPINKQYELFQVALEDLRRKDIQLYFKDEAMQERVRAAHWDGAVDQTWTDDYLLAVDANLAAFKSDPLVKRSMEYTMDMTGEKPEATLSITYRHEGKQKDWRTTNYQSYLRVYVPHGAWLESVAGTSFPVQYEEELNKKVFGMLVQVPLASEKTITLKYILPDSFNPDYYDLKIEKQPGLNDVPVKVRILKKYGVTEKKDVALNGSWTLNEQK